MIIRLKYFCFRSLRTRLGVETDEVALIHLNLALDQIDNIVRELFTNKGLIKV